MLAQQERIASYTNSSGQYTCLTEEVFEAEYGMQWNDFRVARANRSTVDFSSDRFALETLLGKGDGLMNCKFSKEFIEILNLSKNHLARIDCLNFKNQDGRAQFRTLRVLNASRNMLVKVRLEIEALQEVNLSYNELDDMPDFTGCPNLIKLIISHNRIDSDLTALANNIKLLSLDVSSNRFSWKPSIFKRQLDVLDSLHIEELRLWPNPFGEHFKEYQFLTVIAIDSLKMIDDWDIGNELRRNLTKEAENMRRQGSIDWSQFDAKVDERKGANVPVKQGGSQAAALMPRLHELLELLDKPLDNPAELIAHVYDFKARVDCLFRARFTDRARLMEVSGTDTVDGRSRPLKPEEESKHVGEFVDKMSQMLARHESVREVIISCITQLIACGNELLADRCAALLAEWIDANTYELQWSVEKVSEGLMQDLCVRCLPGIQSFAESPVDCYEASQDRNSNRSLHASELESIAESAAILKALRAFGSPQLDYTQGQSPLRSLVLRVFLPALLREPRRALGRDQPSDEWGEYKDYDVLPDQNEEVVEIPRGSVSICRQKCVKQGFSGYVVCEPDDLGSDMLRVYFKRQSVPMLVGLRRQCPHRCLYVRPIQVAEPPGYAVTTTNHAWEAWCSGLAVLVVATDDPLVAARAIVDYKAHELVVQHASEAQSQHHSGFSESWLTVATGSGAAFTLLLRLAQNLCMASGDAGERAVQYFIESKMHSNCWNRIRLRLMEGGGPKSLSSLKEASAVFTSLIAGLVSVVCCMCRGACQELLEPAVSQLCDEGNDVFKLLVNIAADPGTPDPLLLTVALDMIHVFLSFDASRPKVVVDVMTRLHNADVLLPYVRGPRVGETNNLKYQDLWRQCEVKYGAQTSRRERIKENKDWRKLVPPLKDLQHPLMFRVLLGIVKLFELVNDKAQHDQSGVLKVVNDAIDSAGREELLIGPSSGLVGCPDYDVKIECLRCIQHVVRMNASQFTPEEMGWLLRYLTSVGIGIGKQEIFLKELLTLVILLMIDKGDTGRVFRENFGKAAIREAFSILIVNCSRDRSMTPEDEQQRAVLTSKIIELLVHCSHPVAGSLRKFLRNGALAENLVEAICVEDAKGSSESIIQSVAILGLFRTWTGRDMRLVLLPLVTGPRLSMHGRSRYRALLQIADVLEGRFHWQASTAADGSLSSDESRWWLGVSAVDAQLRGQDEVERDDRKLRQADFISCFGISVLLDFAERYFQHDESYADCYRRARTLIEDCALDAEEKVKQWWDRSAPVDAWLKDTVAQQAVLDDEEVMVSSMLTEENEAGEKAQLVDNFMGRMHHINNLVMRYFQCNLNIYNEQKKHASLQWVATALADYFEENQKAFAHAENEQFEDYTKLIQKRGDFDDQICFNDKLMPHHKIHKIPGAKIERVRQFVDHLMEDDEADPLANFVAEAEAAHKNLKQAFVLAVPRPGTSQEYVKHSIDWVRSTGDGVDRRISKNLVDFLDKYGATVYDPSAKPYTSIQRKLQYKYMGDLSRCRDAARLEIEYKSFAHLMRSFKEMLNFNKFRVVRVKNRFMWPTALGRRMLIVNVEIKGDQDMHICELRLTAYAGMEVRRRSFFNKLDQVLRDDCKVPPSRVSEASEFIAYVAESRAMRDRDTLHLSVESGHMMGVSRENVVCSEATKTELQAFQVFRRHGMGVLKVGDVLALKNVALGKYVDVAMTGSVHCRYEYLEADGSSEFVIEGVVENADEYKSTGWFGQNGDAGDASYKGGKKQKPTNWALEPRILHSGEKVRLRLKISTPDAPMYLTTMPQADGWLSSAEWHKVAAKPHSDINSSCQYFILHRQGSLADNLHAGEKEDSQESQFKRDARLKRNLRLCYMRTSMPSAESCPQEGGALRRQHAAFEAVAHKTANKPPAEVLTSRLSFHESTRAPMLIAALARCMYAFVTHPCTLDHKVYMMRELLGMAEANADSGNLALKRLLVLVVAAQTQGSGDRPSYGGNLDLTSAWLPAKILRLAATTLKSTPLGGRKLKQHAAGTTAAELEAQAAERRNDERGVYDQQRLLFLDLIGTYIRTVLALPLLKRLQTSLHRPLNKHELVLLRELAVTVECLIRVFLGNPLRWASETDGGADNEERADQLALPSPEETGKDDNETVPRFTVLNEQRRSEIFSQLIPAAVIRVLVHSMLYGMHREAQAYQHQDGRGSRTESEQKNVRLLSSLTNHSIHAVCSIMHCCDGSEETRCEYEICEAVSQAVTNGAQMVPRSRIKQMMIERSTDKMRAKANALLQTYPGISSGEQCISIAYAWTGFLPTVTSSAAIVPEMQRRLVVVTSRLHVVMFEVQSLSEQDSLLPENVNLEMISVRAAEDIGKVVVSPRISQLIGLCWKENAPDCEHPLELLIFESSLRRRQFREMLRLVHGGLPEVLVRGEFVGALQNACKRPSARHEQIVNVAFLRPQQGETTGASIQVLVLTMGSLALLRLPSFLGCFAEFARLHWDQAAEEQRKKQAVEDSDSDDDNLPAKVALPALDSYPIIKSIWHEPCELGKLHGIWFMAETDGAPKAGLHFQNLPKEEILVFFSDCERQRWRQQLAAVLQEVDMQGDDSHRGGQKGWAVKTTQHQNMARYKEALKSKAKKHNGDAIPKN